MQFMISFDGLSVFLNSDCLMCLCSTNGSYLNWERLRKSSPELKIQHGDIISFSAPPQHGNTNTYHS